MNAVEVYEWYLENGEFDSEILKIMQLECFNKRIEPVKVISYQELGNMLNTDGRFNDERLAMRWWWIFDRWWRWGSRNCVYILDVIAW